MDRLAARRLLAIAFAIGVLADLLFEGTAIGINVVVLVAAVLAAAWFVRRRGRAPDPFDAWLPITALVLAGLTAVRADPFLAGLDLLAAAALVGASMAAFSGLAVTRRSASVLAAMAAWVIVAMVGAAATVLRRARPPRDAGPRRVPAWVPILVRGLVLVVPLVVIFAVLFASADPIFRQGAERVLGFRLDLGDLPGRTLFILAAAWFVAGLLTIAASGIPALEAASLGAAARTQSIAGSRTLGTAEALIVLVGVDLVVGLFVGLQVAYLFGGLDTMAAAGLTYSDYARRGYFELVAAAGLAGG